MTTADNSVCPELVEGLSLVCHPDTPSRWTHAIAVSVARNEWQQLVLRFRIRGDIQNLVVPAPVGYASRCDGLWQTTCVEAFVRPTGGPAYVELNFAPSTAWAAYQFSDYRHPIEPPQIDAPPIDIDLHDEEVLISIAADMSPIAFLKPEEPWRLGLSAVIEEIDGTKSYWALAHPPGKPDFHHSDCFALELPAPDLS